MKIKLTFLLIVVALLSVSAFAQVTITAKKVTYTRPKASMDHKKRFTITYPKIKAATPALSRKIEAVLSYENAFDFKLREELNDIQWLTAATYDVNYNANKILSISLSIEGSGAYPDGSTKYIVVNTATGTRVRAVDVFTNTDDLLAIVVKMKDAEVKKAIDDIKKDPEMKDEDFSGMFSDAETYSKVTLGEFEIDENGVIFHHDYGFPHVAQPLQPPGEFFLTWKELKPFIKGGGLLARFAR
jgi:hypothetical protein